MKYLMPIFVLVTSIFAYATSKPIRVLNDIKQVKDSIEFTPQIIDPDLEYKIYYQAAEYIIKDNPDSIICLSDSIENLNLWAFASNFDNKDYWDFLHKAQIIHISTAWGFHEPIFVNTLAKIKKQLNVNNHNEKRCTDILIFSDIYYNTLCAVLYPPDMHIGMNGRNTLRFYFFVFSEEGDLIDACGNDLIID